MGGVRTALYNYLFAKQNGGDFIIRIEDTDSHRFVPGAEKYIIEALEWCGIHPDEGVDENGNVVETPSERHPHAPYRQSQRKGIYRKFADQLIENGYAYYAFDTAEELDAKRAEAEAAGLKNSSSDAYQAGDVHFVDINNDHIDSKVCYLTKSRRTRSRSCWRPPTAGPSASRCPRTRLSRWTTSSADTSR